MPRGFQDIVNTLLAHEESDRGRSRHRVYGYGSHQDPVYMSGALHPMNYIGDYGRHREAMHRNRHHGGWDLHGDWYSGGVSSAKSDCLRDSLSGVLDGGSRGSRFPSYGMRDAERDWYVYGPSDGFVGYHQGWYGSSGFSDCGDYW